MQQFGSQCQVLHRYAAPCAHLADHEFSLIHHFCGERQEHATIQLMLGIDIAAKTLLIVYAVSLPCL